MHHNGVTDAFTAAIETRPVISEVGKLDRSRTSCSPGSSLDKFLDPYVQWKNGHSFEY